MRLRCAVYGEASVFPIEIAQDAKVSDLQQAIFIQKRFNENYKFDASNLTLYLARKDGNWLKDDENLDLLLQGKVESQYQKLRSSWKLKKPVYFGENFQPEDEEIHVLVSLPMKLLQVLEPKQHAGEFTFVPPLQES